MTDTAAIPGTMRMGLRLVRQLLLPALLLAVAAAVLLALGPLGWRAGWWHFRVGFSTLMPWAAYCGLAAIAVALVALVIGRRVNSARQIGIGILAGIIRGALAPLPSPFNPIRRPHPPLPPLTDPLRTPPRLPACPPP